MGIYVIGNAENVPLPNTQAGLITGDCLWQDAIMVPIDTPRYYELDLKAKRRLENDRVVFVLAAVAQTVTYMGTWRTLIKGGS